MKTLFIAFLIILLGVSFNANAAVNTEAQNAKAVLDALADTLDTTVSGAAGLRIVERFTDTVGDGSLTTEEKAAQFNDTLVAIIQSTLRSHAEHEQRLANDAAVEAAGDTASADLE